MHQLKYRFLFLLIPLLVLASCGTVETSAPAAEDTSTEAEPSYQTISSDEAKKMMDEDSAVIILDVRTKDEFDTGHIEGAILIPDDKIEEKAEEILTDKSAVILVYCRSGRRSALASASLAQLGYTNVYDFGGIIDWNYDVVTE